jgi:hypothetical protein
VKPPGSVHLPPRFQDTSGTLNRRMTKVYRTLLTSSSGLLAVSGSRTEVQSLVAGEKERSKPFLTLALDGSEWSTSRPACFTPRERAPGTHGIEGWVGLVGGGEEKNSQPPPGIEPYNPDPPSRSLVAIPTELSRLTLRRN